MAAWVWACVVIVAVYGSIVIGAVILSTRQMRRRQKALGYDAAMVRAEDDMEAL